MLLTFAHKGSHRIRPIYIRGRRLGFPGSIHAVSSECLRGYGEGSWDSLLASPSGPSAGSRGSFGGPPSSRPQLINQVVNRDRLGFYQIGTGRPIGIGNRDIGNRDATVRLLVPKINKIGTCYKIQHFLLKNRYQVDVFTNLVKT
jgi:hypothetical protein